MFKSKSPWYGSRTKSVGNYVCSDCNEQDTNISVSYTHLFTLVADKNILGNNERVGITYPDLYKDVKEGTVILIDDGLVKMEVVKIDGTDIRCV